MFHTEHCIFAHTLSSGKNFHTCNYPCEKHQVELQDRIGEKHPLLADAACRNTLFNSAARDLTPHIPELKSLGIRHFRVELLCEDRIESLHLLERYRHEAAI